MTLKITLFNHLAALLSSFILMIFIFVVSYYYDFQEGIVLVLMIALMIDLLPSLYLHAQYFKQNQGFTYKLSKDGIVEYYQATQKIYKKTDIKNIVVIMTPNVYRRSNLHIFSIESYNFAKVVMVDGTEIILTCLLNPNIEEVIKILEIPYSRKKRFFCKIS